MVDRSVVRNPRDPGAEPRLARAVTLQPDREPREDALRDVLCGMLIVDDRAHVGEHHARITQVQEAQCLLIPVAGSVDGAAPQRLAATVVAGCSPPPELAGAPSLQAVRRC